MILNCPECSTRFLVNDKLIGETGRKVKCARCKHIWFQEPPVKEELSVNLADIEIPELDEIPDSVKPIPEGSNLPVISNKYKISLLYASSLAVALIVISMFLLTILNKPITQKWEASAAIFEALGVDVPVLGEKIAIEEAKFTERLDEQGHTYVLFDAYFRNKSQDDVIVPRVMVNLYGSAMSGHENLGQYKLDLDFGTLAPGQSKKVHKKFQVRQPGVSGANVTFIEKQDIEKQNFIPHPYLDDVKLKNPDDVKLKSAF